MHGPTRTFARLLGAAILLLFLCPGGWAQAQLQDPLHVESGLISGEAAVGVRVYRGIPYAAPPVDNLRWKPPQPVAAWDGVRRCVTFAPSCPQPSSLFSANLTTQSEDCLYLNVWTPAHTAAERLPVMVWIHGGGYTTGSGSIPYYNGVQLARQGVVVVTINYRLGPFGFFAHPLLSKESPRHVSGNYGFLDQIAALQWVQHNIAAFGGDAGCVTVFGESAGSASICRLLISPLAAAFFNAPSARAAPSAITAICAKPRTGRNPRSRWENASPPRQGATKRPTHSPRYARKVRRRS